MSEDLLVELLDKLSTVGGAGWEVAVHGMARVAMLDLVVCLIVMTVALALVILGLGLARGAVRASERAGISRDAEDRLTAIGVGGAIIAGVALLTMIFTAGDAVAALRVLAAPDWAALQELLRVVR